MNKKISPTLILEIFISLGIFSAVSTTIKSIHADPFTIGIARLLMASFGIFIYMMLKHSRSEVLRYSRSNWRSLGLLGFYFFVHWLTYFFSIKWSTASLGILSLSAYGVILGILSAVLHREPLHRKDLFTSLCCLAGVYFLIPEFNFENQYTLGVLIGLVSAFFYALVPITHKKINHVPLRIRVFYQFFVALIFFLFTFPWSHWELSGSDWGGLIFLGIGATLIAHSLWSKVTSQLPGKTSGLIYFSYIPFSVLSAQYFLGDHLSIRSLFGAFLILAGSVLGLVSPAPKFK